MAKILRIRYSSPRNITFRGVEDFDHVPEDWEDLTGEERGKILLEEEEAWLWENVEVYAEVIEDDA